MTLDKARAFFRAQAGFGGFYNDNSAKLVLSAVNREHGQAAVDRRIGDLKLEEIFGFKPGTRFKGGLVVDK